MVKHFNHVKIPQLDFEMEAVTLESGRTYKTPQGNVYKSITTALSKYNKDVIQEWRKAVGEEEANRVSGLAARRGSAVHLAFEDYIANKLNDMKIRMMMPNIKELFMQLKPEIDEHVGVVYSIEQALYSDTLKIAGRSDLIAEWDGEIAVIDYKTSTREKLEENIQDYFMQGTAYALMFEYLVGTPIDKIVIAIAVEQSKKPQIFVRYKNNYINPLMELLNG
jgi:ATP-dependent exoDNAse (exonuclease V) beta subunit